MLKNLVYFIHNKHICSIRNYFKKRLIIDMIIIDKLQEEKLINNISYLIYKKLSILRLKRMIKIICLKSISNRDLLFDIINNLILESVFKCVSPIYMFSEEYYKPYKPKITSKKKFKQIKFFLCCDF